MLELETMNDIILFELLAYGKGEYELILKNMLDEDFFIVQDKWYDVVTKIIYSNRLIGYVAGNYCNNGLLVLELGYLLSEYRDKGIFVKVLSRFKGKIALHLPNRFLINSLVDNGYAEIVTRNLIKSKFLLSFVHDNKLICTYYYDYNRCGVVYGDLISPLMRVDRDCFNGYRD